MNDFDRFVARSWARKIGFSFLWCLVGLGIGFALSQWVFAEYRTTGAVLAGILAICTLIVWASDKDWQWHGWTLALVMAVFLGMAMWDSCARLVEIAHAGLTLPRGLVMGVALFGMMQLANTVFLVRELNIRNNGAEPPSPSHKTYERIVHF